jgi:hypothetical protein
MHGAGLMAVLLVADCRHQQTARSPRRARGRAVHALICAVIVLLAGCSSTHREAASEVPLVPWSGAAPPQLRAGHVVPASPCRASRLRIVGPGFQFQPAIAGGTGTVTLRNAGPGACQLTGRPDVRLVGAVPGVQQRQVVLPAEPPAFPTVVPPEATLLALPAGGTATLGVDWRNWCVPRVRKAPVPPRAVRITLPGGRGRIDVGYNAVPACDAPGQPATIGVRPFQPSPLPATTPWTTGVVQATVHPLSSGEPSLAGKRGEVIRFAIQLHNASATAVRFDRCPLLIEMLAPAGRPEVHQLNCQAASPIQPAGSLRFEMRIQVPADAPAGDNGLFWALDPTGAQGPQAVSRVAVAR